MKGDATTAFRVCTACCQPIGDQFMYRIDPDLLYHSSCLCCCECQRSLAGDPTCCFRNGRLYCKADYERLFLVRCARCNGVLSNADYVIRAKSRVYHPDCFRCCACARILSAGEQCVLHDEGPFCRADSDLLCQHALKNSLLPIISNSILSPSECDGKTGGDDRHSTMSDGLGSIMLCDTAKQLSVTADTSYSLGKSVASPTSINLAACFPDSPSSQTASSEFSTQKCNRTNALRSPSSTVIKTNKKSRKAHNSSHEKPSRIRTVLSEKQLHTLRACYAANPRPDALMKDQLVEMTGLSPRVIRVWFQNKRCKDKKRSILLKQLREQEQNGGQQRSALLHATPLIASTAIIYDASSIDSAVDIQPCCYSVPNVAC